MKSYKKPLCIILVYAHLLTICGCTSTVVKEREVTVPETVTRQVPYKEPKQVQKFRDIPRVFPLPEDRPMLLAVLPFTSSTGELNDGVEVAEEIEYAMQKHPLSPATYRLLNRTQLNAVLTEKELAGLDISTIKKTRRLLNVEGLITGHIREKSHDRLSFILKAIDTRDASILFTERFEGDYHQTISDVVGVFYDQRVPDGWETIYETKYKTEEKTEMKKKTEKYEVEEVDASKVIAGVFWAVVIAISIAAASKEKK